MIPITYETDVRPKENDQSIQNLVNAEVELLRAENLLPEAGLTALVNLLPGNGYDELRVSFREWGHIIRTFTAISIEGADWEIQSSIVQDPAENLARLILVLKDPCNLCPWGVGPFTCQAKEENSKAACLPKLLEWAKIRTNWREGEPRDNGIRWEHHWIDPEPANDEAREYTILDNFRNLSPENRGKMLEMLKRE